MKTKNNQIFDFDKVLDQSEVPESLKNILVESKEAIYKKIDKAAEDSFTKLYLDDKTELLHFIMMQQISTHLLIMKHMVEKSKSIDKNGMKKLNPDKYFDKGTELNAEFKALIKHYKKSIGENNG